MGPEGTTGGIRAAAPFARSDVARPCATTRVTARVPATLSGRTAGCGVAITDVPVSRIGARVDPGPVRWASGLR